MKCQNTPWKFFLIYFVALNESLVINLFSVSDQVLDHFIKSCDNEQLSCPLEAAVSCDTS